MAEEVLGTNFGTDAFPVEWEEGEKELFWIYDDLHIPNPVSPLFFDIGGWWLTCDHMFRRFGTPFACDWIAKNVNGYVYTAAIPCDPGPAREATEYESRYAPRTPRDPDYAGQIGAYLGGVLPVYAANFIDWWRDRLRPEIERNFAYLDGFDYDGSSLLELAVLLEDAIDIHDRHWKIHWMLNFAQFASTTNLNAVIEEVGADTGLMGRLQSSVEDRNWDAIEDLWKAKEEVKADDELRAAFEGDTAADVVAALEGSDRGRRFLAERIETHQHDLRLQVDVVARVHLPAVGRGPGADHRGDPRLRRDRLRLPGQPAGGPRRPRGRQARRDGGRRGRADRDKLAGALQLSLNMNPLTPDHHFYVDQGTNARLRVAAMAIGRKLAEAGALGRRRGRGVPALQRAAPADRRPRGVRRAGARLRPPRRRARTRSSCARRPGSAPPPSRRSTSRTRGCGGSRTASTRASRRPPARSRASPPRPAWSRGPARFVSSLEEFDQVQQGEILVCRMTNPAWVVLFTKIIGLVTEAGGTVSHPAVVAREFGIPAVVGTGNAGERIKTGDRVRVNGATGVVEILG